jgi:hypothetical protein
MIVTFSLLGPDGACLASRTESLVLGVVTKWPLLAVKTPTGDAGWSIAVTIHPEDPGRPAMRDQSEPYTRAPREQADPRPGEPGDPWVLRDQSVEQL